MSATLAKSASRRAGGLPRPANGAPARARWQALGTTVELLLLGDEEELDRARELVERWLDEVDRACSRFRADSDLTRLNEAGGRAVEVSPLLVEATEVALRAASLTDGDVDPTIGAALELAGYDRDWELMEVARGEPPTRACVHVRIGRRFGWSSVHLDRARHTVKLPPGVRLDLGATAKAWAADRAAKAVCDQLGPASASGGVLVSLGGDIAIAGPPPRDGWQVHVTDDHRSGPDAEGQTVSIRGGGLATSSTSVRRWVKGGETMHHIIDPSTGLPAETPWRTVSVAAASCTDANIAATGAILRGEHAPEWLAGLGMPARLLASDGEAVTVGSWPSECRSQPRHSERLKAPYTDRPSPETNRRPPEVAA